MTQDLTTQDLTLNNVAGFQALSSIAHGMRIAQSRESHPRHQWASTQ